jgi:hypothetical protein
MGAVQDPFYAGEEGGAEQEDCRGQLGHDMGVADSRVDRPAGTMNPTVVASRCRQFRRWQLGGGHGGRGDGSTNRPSPRRGAGVRWGSRGQHLGWAVAPGVGLGLGQDSGR